MLNILTTFKELGLMFLNNWIVCEVISGVSRRLIKFSSSSGNYSKNTTISNGIALNKIAKYVLALV
jgi:hypothetical protein